MFLIPSLQFLRVVAKSKRAQADAVEREYAAIVLQEATQVRLEKERTATEAAVAESEMAYLKLKREKRSSPRSGARAAVIVVVWHHDRCVPCFNEVVSW